MKFIKKKMGNFIKQHSKDFCTCGGRLQQKSRKYIKKGQNVPYREIWYECPECHKEYE